MSVVRLRVDVEWREIDKDVVVLDLRASKYYLSNRTAARLWPLLAEGASRAALAERLTSAYGIDESRAEADVSGFVAWLEERGLAESQPT